jgi:hypothetical protein
MFNNPAVAGSAYQQPVGDAIVVAGRVAPYGAKVTIRFADWFPGWYSFSNMTDWENKIQTTISRKKSAGLTNIYAYELWNEPNGTWNGDANTPKTGTTLSFDQFWKETYDYVRSLDSTVKITGPSVAGYNQAYLNAFLSYCKTNNCLPDIVGWHDGDNIQADVESYRALEKTLGIGPLPITLNEYSGDKDINDEGQPGISASLIAQIERSRVDSACITFWDTAHPGRLGSLLASDTQTNGGWFLYEWYGQMTGNMLSTTTSLGPGSRHLDGFANLNASTGTASVIVGGSNDGTVQIVVKGFAATPSMGTMVHAVVEHTGWTNRTTVATGTDTVSTSDLTVSNDQVSVTIGNANVTDGYRLTLTTLNGAIDVGPIADASTGGGGSTSTSSSSSSGSSGSVGSSVSSGGTPGSSGSSGASGSSGMSSKGSASSGSSSDPQAASAPDATSSGCGCRTAGGSSSQGRSASGVALLTLLALCARLARPRTIPTTADDSSAATWRRRRGPRGRVQPRPTTDYWRAPSRRRESITNTGRTSGGVLAMPRTPPTCSEFRAASGPPATSMSVRATIEGAAKSTSEPRSSGSTSSTDLPRPDVKGDPRAAP